MQAQEELTSSYDSEDDFGWISYFLSQKRNELFCQIDEEYIRDKVCILNVYIFIAKTNIFVYIAYSLI